MLADHLLSFFLLLRIKGELFGQTQGSAPTVSVGLNNLFKPCIIAAPYQGALNLPFIPFYTLFLLLRHALEILLDVLVGDLVVLQVAVEELLVGGHVDETVT